MRATALAALLVASTACSGSSKKTDETPVNKVKPTLKPPPSSGRAIVFAGPLTADAIEAAKKRLAAAKVDATVTDNARGLIVSVRSDADAALAERLLTRPGRLSMVMVVNGHTASRALYNQLGRRGDGKITGETEVWRHPTTGIRLDDHYLQSADRDALVAVLGAASAPAGHAFVVQQLHPQKGERAPKWRSYLVSTDEVIGPDDVVAAEPGRGEYGAYVTLRFTDEGRARFAAATKAGIGRKLAILIDGVAMSVPVVQTEIPGGTAQLTVGPGRGKALELAATLASGPLPPLRRVQPRNSAETK